VFRASAWNAAGGGARLFIWTPASTSFLNNVPPDVLVRRWEEYQKRNRPHKPENWKGDVQWRGFYLSARRKYLRNW